MPLSFTPGNWPALLRLVVVSSFLSLTIGLTNMLLAQNLPDGGVSLIDQAALAPERLRPRFGPGGTYGNKSIQQCRHPAFKRSLKLNITKQPPNTWDAGMGVTTTAAVKQGDAILAGFWARGQAADGSGGGVAEFVFERKGNPYTKSIQYLVETPINGGWQHFWIRCRSLEDYDAGGALVNFQLGYLPATIELAGLEVWNFGDRVKLEDLPHTPLTYVGRERNAPWRAEAEKRIDQHRKGDLTVTVVDEAGRPKSGVPVRVHLDRLAFDFGSCVKAKLITGDNAQDEKYRKTFLKYFNLAVIENGLKWKTWDAFPSNRRQTIDTLRWLRQHDIPVRGHVMVWPGYRYLPPWVKELDKDPQKLRKAIDDHIHEIGTAAGDAVREWDVLNEVFANRDLTNVLGDQEMVRWFKSASKVAPGAKRFYNDYAGLVRGGFPTGHKQHFDQTIRYLKENGAPIDGIGIQGHFGSLLTPPHRLLAELDRWGSHQLGIMITEFDVTVPGETLRADFTRDFLTVCFSHPDVDGVLTWGFWAGAHWKPQSAMFTRDWRVTPMGEQWIRLTTKTWHTDETITTDDSGQVKLRGFLGDYTVTAGAKSQKFHHAKNGSELRLPVAAAR